MAHIMPNIFQQCRNNYECNINNIFTCIIEYIFFLFTIDWWENGDIYFYKNWMVATHQIPNKLTECLHPRFNGDMFFYFYYYFHSHEIDFNCRCPIYAFVSVVNMLSPLLRARPISFIAIKWSNAFFFLSPPILTVSCAFAFSTIFIHST